MSDRPRSASKSPRQPARTGAKGPYKAEYVTEGDIKGWRSHGPRMARWSHDKASAVFTTYEWNVAFLEGVASVAPPRPLAPRGKKKGGK